ncbi:hypothetical protein FYJ74_10000 [Pyramidobacter sp. SM-530-WT-4B]|uniref:Glycosyltransferase RgtA/B/C/D-like domain-containing protein n=1 Tax=Pyramidobacter porci TaxID=2605789 RepID=A0A6L5YE45_9BACT|nr:DUF6020 family protein [Pyramidobacter porci]MST56363.1 hypothetical protein [Pyramidobacter porci]
MIPPKQTFSQPHTPFALPLCAALITTLALSMRIHVPQWQNVNNLFLSAFNMLPQNFNAYNVTWTLLALLLTFTYKKIWERASQYHFFRPWLALLSMFFGVLQTVGLSMNSLDSMDFLLANKYQHFIAVICIIGYAFLFYSVSLFLFWLFDSAKQPASISPQKSIPSAKYSGLWPTLFILLCWAPWLVVYYPGSAVFDGLRSVLEFIGVRPLTDHHPILTTWLIGGLFSLGRRLGNDNLGIFLYVLFQSVLSAMIYGQIVKASYRRTHSTALSAGILIYFSFISYFGGYSQAFVKDPIFSGIFALFALTTSTLLRQGPVSPKDLTAYLTVSLLACLLRHNGIYAVFPTLICISSLIFRKSRQKKTFLLFLTVPILYFVFQTYNFKILGLTPGSSAEALSIPLQQIARYTRDHPSDITEDERATLDKVLPLDKLPQIYDPNLSDPVKSSLRNNATSENKINCVKVWLRMFLRHPRNHFEAFFANSYGYYAFTPPIKVKKPEIHAYQAEAWLQWGKLSVKYHFPQFLRTAMMNYHTLTKKLPVVNLFLKLATYTWGITLICCYFLASRRYRDLIAALPLLLMVLTCIASPVNGHPRYFLPVLAAFPILFTLAASSKYDGRTHTLTE